MKTTIKHYLKHVPPIIFLILFAILIFQEITYKPEKMEICDQDTCVSIQSFSDLKNSGMCVHSPCEIIEEGR